MIEKGQYVKVIFKNSTQLEGIVEYWQDQRAVLKSEDGNNLMIIMNPSEDVMAVKISLNVVDPVKAEAVASGLQSEFEEVRASPSRDELRLLKLADLRKELNNQEKEIISGKLKSHTPSNIEKVSYGIPNLNKKYSPK